MRSCAPDGKVPEFGSSSHGAWVVVQPMVGKRHGKNQVLACWCSMQLPIVWW